MSKSSLSCMHSVKRMNNKRSNPSPLYSDTVFHGDHSGSMSSMGDSPSIGAREFVEKYKKMSGDVDYNIHLVFGVFSNDYSEIYNGSPTHMTDEDIDNCEKAMVPTNMTNFYDTTIDQLDKQGARIERKYNELSKKTRELVPLDTFASVVFAILTDGCDNVSTTYDSKTLKEKLAHHKKKYGASILFMAANMSAIDVGNMYGLKEEECLQMGSDPHYSLGAMNSITHACIRQASGSLDNSVITPLMRMASCSQEENDMYSFHNTHSIHRPRLSRMVTSSQLLPTIDFGEDSD